MTIPPTQPEAWLRGPLPGVDPFLMPAAHAIVQCREDVTGAVDGLSAEQLLVHAAEHAPRHAGQVITTARIVRGQGPRLPDREQIP
jgi:hypothetical protein